MKDESDSARRDRVLRERAERLASAPSVVSRELLFQVAIVLVGEEQVGIPVAHLREIVRVPPVTPLPGMPEGLLGVALLRGEILSVIDLALWVGASGASRRSCLAVLERDGRTLGALADQSLGFRDVFADDLAADLGGLPGAERACISRRTRDLCAVLDVPKLFADPRLVVGAGRGRGGEGDLSREPPGRAEGRS
jgi:purine-binding chemotaxis protein CheW